MLFKAVQLTQTVTFYQIVLDMLMAVSMKLVATVLVNILAL